VFLRRPYIPEDGRLVKEKMAAGKGLKSLSISAGGL
jgi:hypothetical protein